MLPQVHLKKSPLLRTGHPWIFSHQLMLSGVQLGPGSLVDVYTDRGRFIGRGYCNLGSQIAVRLLSFEAAEINQDFFVKKIRKALDLRRRWIRDTNTYRLISSEGDGLPGLMVDRYADVLVVQILTAGMEQLKSLIFSALAEVFPEDGIYERSDSGSRRLEGLVDRVEWVQKKGGDEILVYERDIQYHVKLGQGHKTGFYLDQRDNRWILRDLETRGRALDLFCYQGAFALNLAKSGWSVQGVDIQEENIKAAQAHQKHNGISEEKLSFKAGDVFKVLSELDRSAEKWDLVILDPPSFVKKKDQLEGALAGFKEIALRGMKILNQNGLLALFSCSHHVTEELLLGVACRAAVDARKELKIIRWMKQAPDHPINPLIPETHYLKGFLFEVS